MCEGDFFLWWPSGRLADEVELLEGSSYLRRPCGDLERVVELSPCAEVGRVGERAARGQGGVAGHRGDGAVAAGEAEARCDVEHEGHLVECDEAAGDADDEGEDLFVLRLCRADEECVYDVREDPSDDCAEVSVRLGLCEVEELCEELEDGLDAGACLEGLEGAEGEVEDLFNKGGLCGASFVTQRVMSSKYSASS